MALALNALALIIVLGLCWAAMMWYSGRFHGHEPDEVEVEIDLATDAECADCEGAGATRVRGRLSPCSTCQGTGVAAS